MTTIDAAEMRVESLRRYPVKSMLGESVARLFVDESGVDGDRRSAVIDTATGRIASAKQPRFWRALLKCSATWDTGRVVIGLPDATTAASDDDDIDDVLSQLLGRAVRLIDDRPLGASVERPDPDQVLDLGLDVEVDTPVLEIAQATPGNSFTDYAPLHAVTTATLEHIGAEAVRYRPNLVIATPAGYPPYAENQWMDRILTVGELRLRALSPTPRCVVPTLEHGALARAPHALRIPAAENRVEALDLGVLPCVGIYLEALAPGTVHIGDPVATEQL
jgi:uncharacterized protein